MRKFFTAQTSTTPQGDVFASQYHGARANLLIALIFTVINCVLAVVGGSTYFLFSCSFPYAMASDGAFWTGLMYSAEEYAEYGLTEADMMPIWYLYIMLVPAVISVVVYLLCWIFSKKRVGWLIAATVLFVLDTLFLILYYGVDVSFIMDYVFHAWVLFILIRGIIAHFRGKNAETETEEPMGIPEDPADEYYSPKEPSQATDFQTESDASDSSDNISEQYSAQQVYEDDVPAKAPNSPILHMADFSAKSRVLLQQTVQGYDVCYRKVGKVYELVINSMVYDVSEAGMGNRVHELSCMLDGHEIKAGTGADSHMYIKMDDVNVMYQLRVF